VPENSVFLSIDIAAGQVRSNNFAHWLILEPVARSPMPANPYQAIPEDGR
jgi:hypothetical protein